MKDKIYSQLKTKYSNFGFSENVLKEVANTLSQFVSDENGIEPAVNGAENMLKSFQSFTDARVSNFKTESEKNKAEAEELKTRLANQGNNSDSEVTKFLKELTEKIAKQDEMIESLSAQKAQETLSTQFKTLVKDVPSTFYGTTLRLKQFKDESDVQEFAEMVKKDYEAYKQEEINRGASFAPEKSTPQTGHAIADMINKGTKEIINAKN